MKFEKSYQFNFYANLLLLSLKLLTGIEDIGYPIEEENSTTGLQNQCR